MYEDTSALPALSARKVARTGRPEGYPPVEAVRVTASLDEAGGRYSAPSETSTD